MFLHSNLKFLRTYTATTQAQFGKIFGKTRSNIDSYERGIATPSVDLQKAVADHFNLSLEVLAHRDLKTNPGLMLSGNGNSDQHNIAQKDLVKAKDELIKELRDQVKALKTQNEMLMKKAFG